MKRGWFAIPGVQTGERQLTEQIVGLGQVHAAAMGASVLDVGCAEGLIGRWLLEAGALRLDGIEKHEPYVQMARQVVKGRAHFIVADLDRFDGWRELLPRYDIVLALNVLQKLAQPELLLTRLANMCGHILAISLPAPVLVDARSANVRMDPQQVLGGAFDLIDEVAGMEDPARGNLGHRMVFRRKKRYA
jgi:hypothetical protein